MFYPGQGQGIQSISLDARDGKLVQHNAPHTHSHTSSHLKASVFGQWEEIREPKGNPHGHEENMQNSTQTVT